jgi:uncharacterized GH25 family protein
MRSTLILFLASAHLLIAHDFWIELSNFYPAPNELVRAYLKAGEKFQGQPVVRDQSLIALFVCGTNAIIGLDGKDPAGIFRAGYAGVVGYRSIPRPIELPPVKFEEYLWQEGLEKIVSLRHEHGDAQKPGREIYSRCAKALLGTSPDAAQPLGFRLELIPDHTPRFGPLTVRLVFERAALPGALVLAMNKADPENRQVVRSDAQGQAAFTLSKTGLWLIKAVHMIPARSADADWESLWASLTFELR